MSPAWRWTAAIALALAAWIALISWQYADIGVAPVLGGVTSGLAGGLFCERYICQNRPAHDAALETAIQFGWAAICASFGAMLLERL